MQEVLKFCSNRLPDIPFLLILTFITIYKNLLSIYLQNLAGFCILSLKEVELPNSNLWKKCLNMYLAYCCINFTIISQKIILKKIYRVWYKTVFSIAFILFK